MSYESRLVKLAYSAIGSATPLAIDCGCICSAKCCAGDGNKGMQMLPGEDELLDNAGFTLVVNENGRFCVCDGHCDRESRPFACRIFPYFPMPVLLRSGKYTIRTVPDPRAIGVCPILRSEDMEIQKKFIKKVKKAGRILLRSKKTRRWLLDIADEIRSVAELQIKLNDK